jgi:putative aldouronate transport system permease protein
MLKGNHSSVTLKKYNFRVNWQLYSLILIPMIFYIIFRYVPMIGNVIAFRKFSPGGPFVGTAWVGFRYFSLFITDTTFWKVFGNTLTLSSLQLLIGFPLPIIFALLLNELRSKTLKKFAQTTSYLPHFLSTVIVAGMIFQILSPSSGFVNILIKALGGKPIIFLQEAKWFPAIYVISGVWQGMGFGAIIYLAALAGINVELYESAMIDGANRWQQTLHITIPGILPTVIILFILNIGNLLHVGFEKIFLLYNPLIYDSADVISTYLYRIGMESNSFSYATAIGLFESVIGFILISISNLLSRKFTETSLW